MEWLVFGLVCWVAVRFLGVGRCGVAGGRWARRAMRAGEAKAEPVVRPAPAPAPPLPAETAEARLRRQYVEGTLTTEQYEHELDVLYRPRA